MSITNSIQITLQLKDENITFPENHVSEQIINGVKSLVYCGRLSPKTPSSCPLCGCVNIKHSIYRNGTKSVDIIMPRVSNMKTILRLKKQRFKCKDCDQTFIAETSITKFNKKISNSTYQAVLLDLKNKVSIKCIAKRHDVSCSTVHQWMSELNKNFKINFSSLPDNLSFDEFRSVKNVAGKMSFIYIDSDTGKVLDIVQNRRKSYLTSYFNQFSYEVRCGVKTICIDMYEPYVQLIKSLFPNAKIVTDRFHIIQHLNRALNSTRIFTMNNNKEYYARLKRYWKLMLIDHSLLDYKNFQYFTGYKQLISQSLIISNLISVDSELESTYWLVQRLKKAISNKNTSEFNKLINMKHDGISKQMQTVVKTFRKQQTYINNALENKYSNGKLEGTNNLIKVIKRIAFGYRNFYNFRARILLITNTMVKLEH